MNVFAIIRRSLWAVILAACIIWSGVYLAVWQTLLSADGLNTIVRQSRVADTVRQDILLPRVLATTRSSDYAALLDDQTVTAAFNEAVSADTLNTKLAPAIESLSLWLNSKEPAINFTIDLSDLSAAFADKLSSKIDAKLAALPPCTVRNTLADVQSGVCRSSIVSQKALSEQINQAIKNDPTLKENTTLTPQSADVSSAVRYRAFDLPSYLNMFYGSSIIAAGIGALIILWLLFKHRFASVITIGVACMIAALGLFGGSIALSHATLGLADDELASKVLFTAVRALESAAQTQALWLAIGGGAAIVIGSATIFILARRRTSRQTMHMSDSSPDDTTPPRH